MLKTRPNHHKNLKTVKLVFRDKTKTELTHLNYFQCSVNSTVYSDVHPQPEQVKMWYFIMKTEVLLTATCPMMTLIWVKAKALPRSEQPT
jgi:hypothetical protein